MEQRDLDAVLDALADGPATAEALVQRLVRQNPAVAARGTQWLITNLLRQPEIAYRSGQYELRQAVGDDDIAVDDRPPDTAPVGVDRSIARRYVVVDFETNADHENPAEHEVIEVAAARVIDGEITETFTQLVRNTRPLADVTIETTGLRESDLVDAAALAPTLRRLLDFIGTDPLVAHNGFGFDFVVLDTQCARHDLPPPTGERLDTLDLAHIVFPRVGTQLLLDVDGTHPPENRQLEHLGKYLEVGGLQEHRALADVLLCKEVLDALLARLTSAGAPGQLAAWLLQQGGHPWGAFLPEIDTPPALVEVVPPPDPIEAPPPTGTFDIGAAVAPLDHGGVLLGGGRSRRPQQVRMAQTVAEALAFGRQQLIEAPTGTGKTLAYLTPAIAYSRACGTPVVVAVHSKVLQNQILSTLPELAPAFGRVNWVLLKGLENYCDLEALDALLEAPPRSSDEALALAVICRWVSTTPTGDWDDLHVWGLESHTPIADVRWRLRLTDDPGLARDELDERCFFRRSTRALQAADVAILNHAVMVRRSDWRDDAHHLVLDEAHNLEDAATAAFSDEVTERGIRRLLDQVHNPATRWGTLARWLDATGTSARADVARRVLDARRQAEGAAHNFAQALVNYVRDRSGARRDEVAQFGTAVRLQRGDVVRPSYGQVRASVAGLAKALRDLAGALDELDVPAQLRRRYRRRRLEREIARTGRQLRDAAALLYDIALVTDSDEWVALAELTIDHGRHRWGLRRSPLTVGPHLADLWGELDAVVLTSATLRVGRTTMYLQGRLGLEQTADMVALETPFTRLREHELMVLTDHLPTPTAGLLERFKTEESREIARLLTLVRGRSLVLFTSRARMRAVAEHVTPLLRAQGITVLCQGEAPAPVLVDRMRNEPSTSLLATRSFWEGVDIPGEALSLLVIEKLPFDSPADPIVAARLDVIERQGGDPFAEYLVPQAALRFAQGVGRLIRSETDVGAVVVLDNRLRRPLPYRDQFLGVLPGPPTFVRPLTPDEGYRAIAEHLQVTWDDDLLLQLDKIPSADVWGDFADLQIADDEIHDDAAVIARLEQVRERLGFDDWRPGQLDVMLRIIRGHDVLAVLPTGSGKSLTFQLPALLRPGVTLVVSPLVALMRDQIRSLEDQRIVHAAALHTGQSQSAQEEILKGAHDGRYRLLYVSPERLWSSRFRSRLRDVDIARVVVDEAHCVSQWGYSFRPEYAAITTAVADLVGGSRARPTVAALTATAPREVQDDIRKLLDIDVDDAVVRSPDRPELRYYAVDCTDKQDRDLQVLRIVEAFRDQPVIVYVPRRKDTTRLAGLLRAANHRARPYHGGMEQPERLHTEEAFVDDEIRVVVATKAFGLGIDKPDVAAVVHLEMPASVEEYIQEAGRAARGAAQGIGPKTAACVLLRMPRDCRIHRRFEQDAAPDILTLQRVWQEVRDGAVRPVGDLLPGENEDDAGVAASYLVRAGVLRRRDDLAWTGRVWVPDDAAALLDDLEQRDPKLAADGRKIIGVAERLGSEEYQLETYMRYTGWKPERIERTLLELMRRGIVGFWHWEIAWQLEPTGTEPDWEDVGRQLDARRDAVRRLTQQARQYRGQDKICRRAWLLWYLGDEHGGHCDACDVCRPDLPRPWDDVDLTLESVSASIPATVTCLALVRDTEGFGYSRRTLELVLFGADLKYNTHLEDSPVYGALQPLGREGVTRAVDQVIAEGLIVEEERSFSDGPPYMTLRLTAEGRRRL